MSTTDIRAWLREAGHEVPSRGPLPAALREAYDTAHPVDASDYDLPAPQEAAAAATAGPPSPAVREPTAREKVKSWTRRRNTAPKDRPNPRGRRRASVEGLASGAWSGLAQILGTRQQLLPMARVMALQAPVAGVAVEDGIKGTPLDRVVQPLARMSEKGTEISALLGPPLLVMLISQQPQLYPVLYQPLYSSLVSWCKLAAPALKKKRAEMEKLAAEMKELGAEFGAQEGEDFVDAWIQAFFAPLPSGDPTTQEPFGAAQPEPAREANGRFAKRG